MDIGTVLVASSVVFALLLLQLGLLVLRNRVRARLFSATRAAACRASTREQEPAAVMPVSISNSEPEE